MNLTSGQFYDFEAATGGGVLTLIQHINGCDRQQALAWLTSRGFLRAAGHRPRPAPSRPACTAPAASAPGRTDPVRSAVVDRLWQAATPPTDDSPLRHYLASRWCWPPADVTAAPDLPSVIRWLDATCAPPHDPEASWFGLPRPAAGAMICAWHARETACGPPLAVSLEALDPLGRRPDQISTSDRWRRTFGRRTAAVFETRSASTGPLHLCEGELDALALTIAPWCRDGTVRAVGGTSGYTLETVTDVAPDAGRTLVLHADGNSPGRRAVEIARHRFSAAGYTCQIEWLPADCDPADELRLWLLERAAIREYSGGESRTSADLGAWHDLIHHQETPQ